MNSKPTSPEKKAKPQRPLADPEKIKNRMKFQPSFGRTRSRPLTGKQKELMKTYFPKVSITAEAVGSQEFKARVAGKKLFLEIGFGVGEHLVHVAKTNPNDIIIGCEVYQNSFGVTLQRSFNEGLYNVMFFQHDSRLLMDALPEGSVDRLFILFPDPWPKNRQQKRRIINQQTIGLAHKILKTGGVIRVATDDIGYFESVLELFAGDSRFKKVTDANKYKIVPDDHVETKYHKKALKEGRQPGFVEFLKL